MARRNRTSRGPSPAGVGLPDVTATDSETDVINLGESDTTVGGVSEPLTRRAAVGRATLVWRRMRRMPTFWIGSGVLVLLVLAAIIMPMVYQYTPIEYDYANQLKGPSQYHWFGTNAQGQDLFAQIMAGLRISLVVGFGTAIVVTVLATFFGTLAGYFGGAIDWAVVNLINFLLVVPSLLMMLLLSPILQGAHWILMVPLLAIFSWMLTARVLRALTQGVVNMEYVQAARFMGVPHRKIIMRHIIPNISSWMIIDTTLGVGGAILSETGLSFLGFGILYPNFSLGSVLQGYNIAFPHTWVPAATILALLVISINMVGEALRDALDPTSGRGH